MNIAESNYVRVQREPNYFFLGTRAAWMTGDQWKQVLDFVQGKAVPTDSELIEGFQFCTARHVTSRSAAWAYSNISSAVVNEPNFTNWCAIIRKYGVDPDLAVDEGL